LDGKGGGVNLIVVLDELMEARSELKACYASCDTSPDYFCHDKAVRVEIAQQAFEQALTRLIDDRIEAATGARP